MFVKNDYFVRLYYIGTNGTRILFYVLEAVFGRVV